MKKQLFSFFILILFLTATVPTLAQTNAIEDSWNSKAPMHQARSGLGVIAVDNKIYAIGGALSGFKNVAGTNEQYDPATDTWVYKASMPTPRAYFAIAAYQNKIYCFGGVTGERLVDEKSGFYTAIYSNAFEVYDTVTDTWTTKPPMPKGGGMHISAQEVNGKIYVINPPDIYIYDLTDDTWTERNNLSLPEYSSVIGNKIVAVGTHDIGYSPSSPYYGGIQSVEQIIVYDPEGNNLTQGADASIGVDAGAIGATVGINAPQRVYVMGVKSGKSPPIPVDLVYDLKANNWMTATAMPSVRINFGIANVNDTLYAIGGTSLPYSYDETGKYVEYGTSSVSNINEQYIPIGYGTISPIPTANPSAPSGSVNPSISTEFVAIIAAIAIILLVVALFIYKMKKNNH